MADTFCLDRKFLTDVGGRETLQQSMAVIPYSGVYHSILYIPDSRLQSMSLRLKLLLVALSTLILPWSGWQFVRQTEAVLRQGQEQALLASAATLVRTLDVLGVEVPSSDAALYVHAKPNHLSVDGYDTDWQAIRPYLQTFAASGNPRKLSVMLARDAQSLYLYVRVLDATRDRTDAREAASARKDHLELSLVRDGQERSYRIASAAPGSFEAPAVDFNAAFPDRLNGAWQEDGSGYSIELRLPNVDAPDHLRLAVHDSANADSGSALMLALLGYNDAVASTLNRLAPEDVRLRLVTAQGWLVAAGGALDTTQVPMPEKGWFADFIYRNLLAPQTSRGDVSDAVDPRLPDAEIAQALLGQTQTSWRSDARGDVYLTAAAPMRSADGAPGVLLLEQANPALSALAYRALSSLLGASLLALLVTAGLLLLFGGLLSWRIRRLRNATDRVTRAGGQLAGPLPLADSRDELGDLARSFGRLFDEVGGYTNYLRTLASKLSHELNTPLAIVQSSLDNLDHQKLPGDAQPYLDRARDGVGRLAGIVRAMSESSRIERAIAAAEGEDFDLRALVEGCAEGYRALAGTRELRVELPAAALPMHGAPDLVAQALDKLFDNARSFADERGWISISLVGNNSGAILKLSNSGPVLPETMQDRLFDSLVSVREPGTRSTGEAPHLGLGLHVVRLVAELHQGHASARNLENGEGVEFSLIIKGMARRRLSEVNPA